MVLSYHIFSPQWILLLLLAELFSVGSRGSSGVGARSVRHRFEALDSKPSTPDLHLLVSNIACNEKNKERLHVFS